MNGVKLEVDKSTSRHERNPFLEVSCLIPGKLHGPEEELPKEMVKEFEDGYGNPRFKNISMKILSLL